MSEMPLIYGLNLSPQERQQIEFFQMVSNPPKLFYKLIKPFKKI